MKKLVLIFVLSTLFSSCEKDDICDAATETTPMLIIEFYDVQRPTVLKNVTNLEVKEIGSTAVIPFTNSSKIELPLKTNDNFTKYSFKLSSTSVTSVNEDFVQFSYTRQNIFVSRACGYKTIYNLSAINPYLKTDSVIPDGFWIQNLTVITSNIITKNETHIKIYF